MGVFFELLIVFAVDAFGVMGVQGHLMVELRLGRVKDGGVGIKKGSRACIQGI